MTKRKFISNSILFLVLLVFLAIIIFSSSLNNRNLFVILGFISIGAISLINIVEDTRIYSINKLFWYFELIFFCAAPLCQYLSEYYPWGYQLKDPDIIYAEILIFLWCIIYHLSYRYKFSKKYHSKNNLIKSYCLKARYYSSYALQFIFIIAILFFILLISMTGFYNLFFRSENTIDIENSTLNFIIRKFLTAFPSITCSIFIILTKQKEKNYLPCIICLLIIVFCSNFPLSTTRYWMGTIFIGIFLTAYAKRKESRLMDYGILFGFLVLFPFLFLFKTVTIIDLFNGKISYTGILNSFNSIDFDAFSLFVRTIMYVRENGLSFGWQLMNILFFMIPRRIWPSKPTVTSVLVASSQHQRFTNLSEPLQGEAYINFGILGIIGFALLYAKFNKTLDDWFWKESSDNELNIINIAYPYIAVITLYINRGPLQPAFIQTIALLSPLFLISSLSKSQRKEDHEK